MRKLIGLISFFIAIGMILMLLTHSRLIGLLLIMMFLFIGYNLFCQGH